MSVIVPNNALDAEMLQRMMRMIGAVRDGERVRWSYPDPPGDLFFGQHTLTEAIEELVLRNMELANALLVAEDWATGNIDDPAHPDHKTIKKALRKDD